MTNRSADRWLTGFGRLPWADVKQELSGMCCAWADYDGFHVGESCPDKPPHYTHLWAWNSDHSKLARVRIDGAEGIVGVLSVEAPQQQNSEKVQVSIAPGLLWGDDGQLGRRYGKTVTQAQFTVYEPLIRLPAAFVAVVEPSAKGK